MKGLFAVLLLFSISSLALAVNGATILEESFESNLNGWTGLRTENWEFTTNWAKDGQRAIVNFDKFDSGMLKSIGTLSQGTYECWFYDQVTNISESLCMVSTGAISSQSILLIGTETQMSKTNYSYFLSPDANSWGIAPVQRSAGWHQARFVKTAQVTELHIDGVKVAQTTNNHNWNFIGFILNNWFSSPGHEPAIFDALRVYDNTANESSGNASVSNSSMEIAALQTQIQVIQEQNSNLSGRMSVVEQQNAIQDQQIANLTLQVEALETNSDLQQVKDRLAMLEQNITSVYTKAEVDQKFSLFDALSSRLQALENQVAVIVGKLSKFGWWDK